MVYLRYRFSISISYPHEGIRKYFTNTPLVLYEAHGIYLGTLLVGIKKITKFVIMQLLLIDQDDKT